MHSLSGINMECYLKWIGRNDIFSKIMFLVLQIRKYVFFQGKNNTGYFD